MLIINEINRKIAEEEFNMKKVTQELEHQKKT